MVLFGESLLSLFDKLNKLMLSHSNHKLIKLLNNPSDKKIISLASRILLPKNRLPKEQQFFVYSHIILIIFLSKLS